MDAVDLEPTISNDGAVVGVGPIVEDISGRQRAEEALRESERRFKIFAEATSDWLWEMDENLRYTWFSDKVEEVTGVAPQWHYGKTREEIGAPSVPTEVWEQHLDTLRQRKPYRNFVFCRRGPDGDKWMRSNGVPIFDDGGSFRGYMGTGSDITAEVEANRRANRARELLENAIEAMAECFVLWDAKDRLVLCNGRFREINQKVVETTSPGTTFDEHIRAALANGLYPEANDREEEWLAERLHRHSNPGAAFELARQDGRWLLIHEQRLPDGNIATISTDITERKEAEQRAVEAMKLCVAVTNWSTEAAGIAQLRRSKTLPPVAFDPFGDGRWEDVHRGALSTRAAGVPC